MDKGNAVETSPPNAGRIYDYLLGGIHNLQVDRQAAEQIKTLLPYVDMAARLQRWCLRDLAIELTERRGFDVIVDFASGLPTNDHIHHVVPLGTIVIYSDNDPTTVQYAREILGSKLDVYYFEADARRPEELLNHPQVTRILNGRRDIALVYWGIGAFLTDAELGHVARTLYDWSGPKSCWAFNAQGAGVDENEPAFRQVIEMYRNMGARGRPHSLKAYQQLVHPWHVDENGFISLLDWHRFDPSEADMNDQDCRAWGQAGGGYGGYLVK